MRIRQQFVLLTVQNLRRSALVSGWQTCTEIDAALRTASGVVSAMVVLDGEGDDARAVFVAADRSRAEAWIRVAEGRRAALAAAGTP